MVLVAYLLGVSFEDEDGRALPCHEEPSTIRQDLLTAPVLNPNRRRALVLSVLVKYQKLPVIVSHDQLPIWKPTMGDEVCTQKCLHLVHANRELNQPGVLVFEPE
jgi:hypothetical protein